jgi:hypothetical protein
MNQGEHDFRIRTPNFAMSSLPTIELYSDIH